MARQLLGLLNMNERNGNDAKDDASLSQVVRTLHGRKGEGGVREAFHRFAHTTSAAVGMPLAFILAVMVVIIWAVTGPLFRFSDSWQLVINTGTTIITFLMVFLIQNTQNRDAKAIHLKLDELIRTKKGARNTLVDLEDCTDEELAEIEREFKRVRERASERESNRHGRGNRNAAHRE